MAAEQVWEHGAIDWMWQCAVYSDSECLCFRQRVSGRSQVYRNAGPAINSWYGRAAVVDS